jgi:hypothetical protein
MKFYLGTHRVSWLGRLDVPLFVSNRTLMIRKTFPQARAPWCLDSGGFSELSIYDAWRTTSDEYIKLVRRYQAEIGNLVWAAPQDWMCEPAMLAKTGKTILDHQRLTVDNFLTLRHKAPELPFIPVLQGWDLPDYARHVDMYDDAGVELLDYPTIGLGSVCRRQSTKQVNTLVQALYDDYGLPLHGFGVKAGGLKMYGDCLASSDSMAWSFGARWKPPLPGCTHKHCNNCPEYALKWRTDLLNSLPRRMLTC